MASEESESGSDSDGDDEVNLEEGAEGLYDLPDRNEWLTAGEPISCQ